MTYVTTDKKTIEETLYRGVEEVIDKESLERKLASGEKLRVKLGIDPTSPYLHLGRSIPLLKLRDFQKLGHQIVFIVGDFTGLIGDTSDKDAERPMLDETTIRENMKTYKEQVGSILNLDACEIHYNSEWLAGLTYKEIGKQADMFSVNHFISRDNIRRRLEGGKRVSLREVLYPLMQGYDSVQIRADVELGGMDQKFNLLAGRDMQREYGQGVQDILMTPLVNGFDGQKMSSSWGNTVSLTAEANEMYGKVMSMRDDHIVQYFTLMTRVPLEEVSQIDESLKQDDNPKQHKMRLAREIVSMYHNENKAVEAEKKWEKTFSQGQTPDNATQIKVKMKMPLADILVNKGIVSSKSEFRRLVEQGAIKLYADTEEKKIADPNALAEESGDLKIGKKKFLKLKVVKDTKKEQTENEKDS